MTRSLKPVSEQVLSERQEQVLMLVAQGKTYPQIAKLLSIARSTASQTMSQAMIKFNCANAAQLVYKYYAEPYLGPLSRLKKKEEKGDAHPMPKNRPSL